MHTEDGLATHTPPIDDVFVMGNRVDVITSTFILGSVESNR